MDDGDAGHRGAWSPSVAARCRSTGSWRTSGPEANGTRMLTLLLMLPKHVERFWRDFNPIKPQMSELGFTSGASSRRHHPAPRLRILWPDFNAANMPLHATPRHPVTPAPLTVCATLQQFPGVMRREDFIDTTSTRFCLLKSPPELTDAGLRALQPVRHGRQQCGQRQQCFGDLNMAAKVPSTTSDSP